MADLFRPGDFYRQDDRTGRKVRASHTMREWTGVIVDSRWYEPRQPQDFVRGVVDKQTVPQPRPVSTARYIGPRTTTLSVAAAAGDTDLSVGSSANMAVDDSVTVMLDNNEIHRTTIASITDGTSLTLTDKLPWAASAGNLVVDSTAAIAATLP